MRSERDYKIRHLQTLCLLLVMAICVLMMGLVYLGQIVEKQAKELKTSERIGAQTLCENVLPAAMPLPYVAQTGGGTEPTDPETTDIFLGTYTCYAYCPCEKCCGKTPDHPAYGITASGKAATAGRTVAVDPDLIPLGSLLLVDGVPYIAEDTGDGNISGQAIDIYFADHQQAVAYGVQQHEVYLIAEGGAGS